MEKSQTRKNAAGGTHTWRLICLALMVWLGAAGAALAQETSVEFWPENDTWLRLTPAWRLSAWTALSKNIETDYREGSLILQADFAFGKMQSLIKRWLVDGPSSGKMRRFMLRGGYLRGKSLDDQGEAYQEDTALLELHVRTPLKGRFLLSHRLRSDLRWLNADHAFSTRYRYRLMLEKEFLAGGTSIVPYVNAEWYYDSRYAIVNRVRLIGGTTVALSKLVALEANITYQYDSKSSVTNLYALNIILHLYFETAGAREPQ